MTGVNLPPRANLRPDPVASGAPRGGDEADAHEEDRDPEAERHAHATSLGHPPEHAIKPVTEATYAYEDQEDPERERETGAHLTPPT